MDVRVWPGDPETVWDSVDTSPLPTPDRPEVPPWRSRDDFLAHVALERTYVVLAIGFGLLAAVLGVIGTVLVVTGGTAWPEVVKTVAGVVMIVAGLALAVGMVRVIRGGRSGWDAHVDATYRRARSDGVATHAYRLDYDLPQGEGADPAVLLVDSRLSDAAAGAVYAAATTWVGRLRDDKQARTEADRAFRPHHVVAMSDILGPRAEGAWIARDRIHDTPWRLLLPDPSADDGFGLESVLAIRDPDRADDLEHLRLPSAGGVLDFFATLALVVGAVAGYFWFRTSLTRTNYWWDTCADRFCAVGHDLRMMLLEALSVIIMVAGGIWAPRAFARRRLRWLWALIGIGVGVAITALNVYLARVHPWE